MPQTCRALLVTNGTSHIPFACEVWVSKHQGCKMLLRACAKLQQMSQCWQHIQMVVAVQAWRYSWRRFWKAQLSQRLLKRARCRREKEWMAWVVRDWSQRHRRAQAHVQGSARLRRVEATFQKDRLRSTWNTWRTAQLRWCGAKCMKCASAALEVAHAPTHPLSCSATP